MSNEEKTNVEAAEEDKTLSQEVEAPDSAADSPAEENAAEWHAEASAEGETKEAAAPKAESENSAKPPKAKKGGKIDLSQNKLFKAIYYPVVAVLAVVMLVFSIIDGVFGYSPEAYDDGYYQKVNAHIAALSASPRSAMSADNGAGITAARDYIQNTLTAAGYALMPEEKTDDEQPGVDKIVTVTDWHTTAGADEPTVTRQTSPLTVELQKQMGAKEFLAGVDVTNIVVGIPSGNNNASSVVLTVRYDSRPDSNGAADNAAFVANVLQTLVELKAQNAKFANDVIVVFTEELDLSFGSYLFFDAFEGFNNVAARAKAGVNLDAYGNGGTLALTDASSAGYAYINEYTKVSGSAFNSSLVTAALPDNLVNKNAVKAFGSVPAVQVAVLGGLDKAESRLDTAENVSQAIVKQQAQFVKEYIARFGASDKAFAAGDGEYVYFSYLDGGTVTYNAVTSYVVGALMLALIAGVIVAMALKKTFSVKNMFAALGMQLIVIAGTLVAMLASYFLVTLMLTGFGVLPIHAITSLRYFNAGILIAAMIVSVAAAFGFTTLGKKLFRVTSSDAVRGTAMLIGIVGAIMSFACPAYSYVTSWLGLLLLAVLLVSVLCHKAFKNALGIGMDRLYLYVLPVIICLPLVMAGVAQLIGLLPMVLMPVVMMLFTAIIGVIVPYLDRTQKVFDRVAKKLPQRTVRVQRTVTERVEDRAKKGKFTERTVKRIEKEKVAVNYKNYFGISVLAVLGIVVALFSSGFGVSFGKTLTGYHSYNNAIYNDAIVYEWTKDGSSAATQRLVVDDLTAYKFIRYSVTDLDWDGSRYVKSVNYSSEKIGREPNIEKVEDYYVVTTNEGASSHVTLRIPSASSITKITVKDMAKESGDYKGYVYEFENESTITLRLPYGFASSIKLEIEGANPSKIEYEEYRSVNINDSSLNFADEWNKVQSDFLGTEAGELMRGGIVLKRSVSL